MHAVKIQWPRIALTISLLYIFLNPKHDSILRRSVWFGLYTTCDLITFDYGGICSLDMLWIADTRATFTCRKSGCSHEYSLSTTDTENLGTCPAQEWACTFLDDIHVVKVDSGLRQSAFYASNLCFCLKGGAKEDPAKMQKLSKRAIGVINGKGCEKTEEMSKTERKTSKSGWARGVQIGREW